jgi:hypothetical protein
VPVRTAVDACEIAPIREREAHRPGTHRVRRARAWLEDRESDHRAGGY